MKGTVKLFINEKMYGFIAGDDHVQYFFHASELQNNQDASFVVAGARVEFEPLSTHKGMRATCCRVLDSEPPKAIMFPNDFFATHAQSIGGWDEVGCCDFLVRGSSRASPAAAKEDAIVKAKSLGANALLGLHFFETTGDEPGRGKRKHYYTIHNFWAAPVVLGRGGSKDDRETCNAEFNRRVVERKSQLRAKTIRSRVMHFSAWCLAGLITVSAFSLGPNGGIGGFLFVIWYGIYMIGLPKNHDEWLYRRKGKP